MTKHAAGLHCQDAPKGGCEKKQNTRKLLQDTKSNLASSCPPPPNDENTFHATRLTKKYIHDNGWNSGTSFETHSGDTIETQLQFLM